MTDENAQVIAALNKDFLHTYVELAERGTHAGEILYDGAGIPVRVKHTTTQKFGPGYSQIFKNDVPIGKFNAMRGCVSRDKQGQFIYVLKRALE